MSDQGALGQRSDGGTHLTSVGCLWCDYRSVGPRWEPYEVVTTHQIQTHGVRRLRCGCHYIRDEAMPVRSSWRICDAHRAGYLEQYGAELFARYDGGYRYPGAAPLSTQPSLLSATVRGMAGGHDNGAGSAYSDAPRRPTGRGQA